MKTVEDLGGNVRRISEAIAGSLRTEPENSNLAGWGQFLEAASRVFQIGPYGTAAGVAVSQIAFPDAQIDARVKARLRNFWEEKPAGKMYPQNVRLAFIVLALARVRDGDLLALRDEIVATIRARQLPDGSWNESPPHATSTAGGQPDATAWTILALRRSGGSDVAVQRGAAWLAARADGGASASLLSTLSLAAAIAGHLNSRSVAGLRARGLRVLAEATVNREELISFFDYDELKAEGSVQARDYLCYPAFYPLAVLAAALEVRAGWWEAVRLDAFRSDAIHQLIELSGGYPYKNGTARFSSTVDQAIYALSYEELASAEASGSRTTGIVAPLYRWSRHSIFVQLVLPVLFILSLAMILASPTWVAGLLAEHLGKSGLALIEYTKKNEGTLQAFVGIAATLIFGTPRRGRELLWKRFQGRRG